jgi:hypothetical protein
MMHAEPKAATVRPKGIACPCGGRYETTHTLPSVAGSITRHRRCLACRSRVVTRERVLTRAKAITAVSSEPPPASAPTPPS